MRAMSIIGGCLVWSAVLAGESLGQPVLDRVERFLRDQVGAAQPVPQPAPAQPTPALATDQPTAGPAGTSETGYLGLTADDRQDLGRGVRIISVTPGGPASQAGLLNGDLIVAIDGAPVRIMDDMGRAMSGKVAGTRVAISVNRVGVERRHDVTLGRRPQSRVIGQPVAELPPPPQDSATPAPAAARPRLGVRTVPVLEAVRLQNNLPPGRGAAVVYIAPGSPAERAGIPLGAVITAVGSEPVETPEGLAAAVIRAGDAVELTYLERGLQSQKTVSLMAQSPPTDEPKLELRGRPAEPAGSASQPAGPGPSPTPTAAEAATVQPTPATVPSPAPEKPTPGPSSDEPSRIEELEARIRDLEARVEKLEAAQSAPTEAQPAPAEAEPAQANTEPPTAEAPAAEAEAPK
ncbi:MAG: PDZ domain-containing protein [Pirellulales bacterium]